MIAARRYDAISRLKHPSALERMTDASQPNTEVEQFILDRIDSVPHLESLLLLWNTRPSAWTVEELAARLYTKPDVAKKILEDLARESIVAAVPEVQERYCYYPKSPDQDRVMELVDATYRRELVRLSTLLHRKAPPAVREFARAFRFIKEKE